MKALFKASLHDAVVKMQHFIYAVAAIDRKLENREQQTTEGLLWWSKKLIQSANVPVPRLTGKPAERSLCN